MGVDRALQVLKVQAEFDLAEAALSMSRSVQQRAAAEAQLRRIDDALDVARGELRRQVGSTRFDPARYDWLRRAWQAGLRQREGASQVLGEAERALEAERMALARSRQRDADLARALEAQARLRRLAEVVREHHAADDLWLQTQASAR